MTTAPTGRRARTDRPADRPAARLALRARLPAGRSVRQATYRAWRYDHSTLAVSGPKNGVPPGRPTSVDIDAMHTYRDAILTAEGQRAVEYAAILYPGGTEEFGCGIAALRAQPGEAESLRAAVVQQLERALATAPTSGMPRSASANGSP